MTMKQLLLILPLVVGASVRPNNHTRIAVSSDSATVALLDERYQAAVEANDVAGMDSILANDFTLVIGTGRVFSKRDLVEAARRKDVIYERQTSHERSVRVSGNTAIVTAMLWEKGTVGGKAFDKKLWFSDTYVRTPAGWRYFFGQASLPLPPS